MASLRRYRHRRLEDRVKVYDRVHELRSSGTEIRDIAGALGISRRDVSYWLRMNRPSREVYDPDLAPRPELAYLVGAYLGDGRTAGPKDKKVRFKVADAEFADSLNKLVATVLGAKKKEVAIESGFYSVSYDGAALYDFLQQPIEAHTALIGSFPGGFLRGFFDAEGYVTQNLSAGSRGLAHITVGAANTNLVYLDHVTRLLASLGISSRLRRTNKAGQLMKIRGRTYSRRSDVYHVEITDFEAVNAFQENVGFSIPQKAEKLRDLVALASTLHEGDKFGWFSLHYEKVGRKWVRRPAPVTLRSSRESIRNDT